MVTSLRAETVADVVEAVRGSESLYVCGADTQSRWRLPAPDGATKFELALSGVVEYDVADQVVVVRAGTTITALNAALGEKGYCIPHLPLESLAAPPRHQDLYLKTPQILAGADVPNGNERLPPPGSEVSILSNLGLGHKLSNETNPLPWGDASIGGSVALNLPHLFEHAFGNWRDWILGLTVVRGDGEIAKVGSKAVKSVAGYDLAKLFVGSRGALGIITELILRVTPIRALPQPDFIPGPAPFPTAQGVVQRVQPANFHEAAAAAGETLASACPKTATLVHALAPEAMPKRFAGDWWLAWGRGASNIHIEDPTLANLMTRAKHHLDPMNKFNRGEFGLK